MTEQEGISKMETVGDEEQELGLVGPSDFADLAPSTWDDEYRRLWIELQIAQRNKMIYRSAWLAAKKQAMEEMEVVGYQIRHFYDVTESHGAWVIVSKETYDRYASPLSSDPEVETRTLYAKKGE